MVVVVVESRAADRPRNSAPAILHSFLPVACFTSTSFHFPSQQWRHKSNISHVLRSLSPLSSDPHRPSTMQKTTPRPSRKDTVLSRRYIEGLIADGKHVMIFENAVLKVDAYMKFHPGGEKPMKHMVGRDATDEINAYVPDTILFC